MLQVRDLGTQVHDKLDVFNDAIHHLDTADPNSRGKSERAIQAYEQKPQSKTYYDEFQVISLFQSLILPVTPIYRLLGKAGLNAWRKT